MKKYIAIIIALVIGSLWAGNSIFSYEGFPVQSYGKDVYSLGMGDTGASDVFRLNTGFANPAMTDRSNKTLFATGILMGYTKYQSEYNGVKNNFRDDSLDFPYFSISVPLKQNRFSMQFNSQASGVVANQTTLPDGSVENQTSDKYLYRADLLYSRFYKDFSMGVGGNFYFGHDKQSFSQTGLYSFNTKEVLVRDFKNIGFSAGMLQRYRNLSVGAHVMMPVTLKGDLVRSSIHNTEAAIPYEYKLPAQYNSSATIALGENFRIASDVSYETWETISKQYRNTAKVGVGLAFEPDQDEQRTSLGRMPLRLGASYRQLAFKDKAGKDIDETALSCGLTLPLKSKISRIDLGFQYLQRGQLSQNKLSDTSFMFMLGLTGFDIITRTKDNTAPRDIPIKEEIQ